MAGDWIPMRTTLEDDPTVIFIARVTKLTPDHVVGKLHRFWSWADSHTADGAIAGVDAAWIDGYVKKTGFAKAMADAPEPWLCINRRGVSIPNFENWFGTSAKRRLSDTKRKHRVRNLSANCPQGERTKTGLPYQTEEKRRVLAPALGAAEIQKATDKAREVAGKLGRCGTEKNRRLVLGACVLSEELGEEWLDSAVSETRDAHPEKPYAYLRTVLTRTADNAGVDFRSSVAQMTFPVAKRPTLVPEDQHADLQAS